MVLCCVPIARAVTSHLQLTPRKTAAEAQATQLQASLTWKEVSPPNRDVYMSFSVALGDGIQQKAGAHGRCNSGYMGAQFRRDGSNTLLWSMSGREEGQVVPVSEYCHYDCFDCSPPNRRDFQCKRDDYKLSIGVIYTFTMQMEMQNASGAMWSVTVFDPSAAGAGQLVEVGRVFFKDREFGLPTEVCRVLGVDPYAFQEYWNSKQQDHTTRASWSAIAYSGVMKPQDAQGYCQGGAQGSLLDLKGVTRAVCKGRCMADAKCLYASYSDVDFAYAAPSGSHCMLFDRCEAKGEYLADLWWTYEKVEAPILVATSLTEKCERFKDQNCNDRIEASSVHRLPGGAAEFEFDAGPRARCAGSAAPVDVPSERCPSLGVPAPAGPSTAALRGAAAGGPSSAAAPGPVAAGGA